METKNNLGIWMDHSTAHLININSKNKGALLSQNLLQKQKKKL